MKHSALLACAAASSLMLASCATTPEAPTLNQLARDYLAVQLAIGEKDPGYVDAYYGPPELAEQAAAQNEDMSLQFCRRG